MSIEEKILLLKLILEDIRGNWGWETGNRDAEAYKLSRELYKSTNNEKWDKLSECIARYEHGEDGRYFRDYFPNGYMGMESLYSITETYKDKSDEFKAKVKEYLTYPEYHFEDFREE